MDDPFRIGLVRDSVVEPLYMSPRQRGQAMKYDDTGGLRQCGRCLERKLPTEFYASGDRVINRRCKSCTNRHLRQLRSTPKGYALKLAASRKYNKSKKNKEADKRYYHKKGRELNNERRRLRTDRVVTKYGGMCVCCGETIRDFLTLDHVNNDGNVERRTTHMTKLYKKLDRATDRLPGYQILCCNCNFGKHRNGGVCPHDSLVRLIVANE